MPRLLACGPVFHVSLLLCVSSESQQRCGSQRSLPLVSMMQYRADDLFRYRGQFASKMNESESVQVASSANCKVVVVGSSVAKGQGATNSYGWASLLGASLAQAPYNLELINVAHPGDNTEKAKPRLAAALSKYQPKVVIFGLSLANQGLTSSPDADSARLVAEQFYNGYHELAAIAKAAGATVIFGGLYPHGSYNSLQKERLLISREQFMREATQPGGIPYIDFFSTTGDSSTGQWLPGFTTDPGHPNDVGFQKMFEAIDLGLFSEYSCSAGNAMREYAQVSTGACRGLHPSHNDEAWYDVQSDFHGNLAHCKALCSASASCVGIEYQFNYAFHCELWTQMPRFGTGNTKWGCFQKILPTAAFDYEPVMSGACRGASADDDSADHKEVVANFNGKVADCEALCSDRVSCVAIEFQLDGLRCELWTREPLFGTGSSGWSCLKKIQVTPSPTPVPPAPPPPTPAYDYAQVATGACRGLHANHNDGSWYEAQSNFNGNVNQCQELCSANVSCVAVEIEVGNPSHCELWTQTPRLGTGNTNYECFQKLVPSAYNYIPAVPGACRGASADDDSADHKEVVANFNGLVADCEALCSDRVSCVAIEFQLDGQRCELWTREPLFGTGNVGWACLKKVPGTLPTPTPPQAQVTPSPAVAIASSIV